MNSRLTSQHYRIFAEGLLKRAIDAPSEQKQDFIRDAISYLAAARTHDERCPSTDPSASASADHTGDDDGQYRQVQQLIKQALEVPTPEELKKLLDFSTGFRRLSVWNAHMVYIQRPGARIVATEYEWRSQLIASKMLNFRRQTCRRTTISTWKPNGSLISGSALGAVA